MPSFFDKFVRQISPKFLLPSQFFNFKSHTKYSQTHNCSGYSLFEFALTLPVLLVFILGAIDVTSSLQAYTALQEGVRSAVRCSTTTDGDCLQTAAVTRDPLFNWRVFDTTTGAEYFGRKYYFGGTQYSLNGPLFSLSNFRARKLDTLIYSGGGNVRTAAKLTFNAQGRRDGVLTAVGPRVSVDRSASNISTVFKYQRYNGIGPSNAAYNFNNSSDYPRAQSAAFSLSVTPGQTSSTTVNINIPNSLLPAGCFLSENVDQRSNTHNASATNCQGNDRYNDSFPSNGGLINAVVYVSASSSRGGGNSVSGVLSLGINNNDFGGRAFSNSPGLSDASLCPRGVQRGYLERESGCNESQIYDEIRLVPGQNNSFHLSLAWDGESGGGTSLAVNGNIHVYLPQFNSGSNGWRNCRDPLLPSQVAQEQGCNLVGSNLPASTVRFRNAEGMPQNFVSTVENVNLDASENGANNSGPVPANCEEVAAALGAPVSSIDCGDYYDLGTQYQEGTVTINCPENNTGQGVALDGSIENQELALSSCPPQNLPSDFDPTLVQFTSSLVTDFGTPQTVTWQPRSCSESSPSLPAALTNYYSYDFDSSYQGHEDLVAGPDSDPREILGSPDFSCSILGQRFQVDSTEWSANTLENEEFFEEVQFEHTVGCAEEAWQQEVRDRAIAAGMPAQTFFEAWKRTSLSSEEQGESILDRVSEAVWNANQDECYMPFNPGRPDDGELVYGNCDSNTAPAACSEAGKICVQEFGGFCEQNDLLNNSDNNPSGQSIQLAAAQNFFYGRVQSNFPKARLGCEGANCVQLREVQGTSSAAIEGIQTVAYEGEITTPLLLPQIFGTDSYTFRYIDERTMESEFAR